VILAHVAVFASLVAAVLTWSVSRLVSTALALACVASVVYAFAPWEPLRWVSALVGLAGAVEMGWRAHWRSMPGPWIPLSGLGRLWLRKPASLHAIQVEPAWWAKRWALGRVDAIALLCFASMVGDMAAMLVWRRLGEWVMPVSQIVVCLAICVIARWPKRRLI